MSHVVISFGQRHRIEYSIHLYFFWVI